MAVAQVQKATVSPGAATSSTATYGSTPTNNNLLTAVYRAATASGNITVPSGWSIAATGERAGLTVLLCYKVAATDPTGVTFTTSGSVNQDLAIAEYSGITAVSPLDRAANAASAGTTSTSQSTGTTAATTQNDELVIAGLGLSGASGGFANTWTNSFTQQAALGRSTWAHRIVSATGTFETTEAWTSTNGAAAVIATFKASAHTTTARTTLGAHLSSTAAKHGIEAASLTAAVSLPSVAAKHGIAVSRALVGAQPTGADTKVGIAATAVSVGTWLSSTASHIGAALASLVFGAGGDTTTDQLTNEPGCVHVATTSGGASVTTTSGGASVTTTEPC